MSIQFAPVWNSNTVQTCIRANATDTLSAASSTLIDLSVNGVSQFSVDKTGNLRAGPTSSNYVAVGSNTQDVRYGQNGISNYASGARYDIISWTGGICIQPIIITGYAYCGLNIQRAGTGVQSYVTVNFSMNATGASGATPREALDVRGNIIADGNLVLHKGTTSTNVSVHNTFTDLSNYERLALQFTTYSTARYAQLACESAGTGIANMNLVLTPKGTGALIAGPMPDGTAIGGNARGANAIDLQTSRTAATQVASGTASFAAGSNSAASGANSTAIGNSSVASGFNSLALGYNAGATNDRCIAIGEFCSASGILSTMIGRGAISGALTFGFGRRINEGRPGLYVYGQGYFAADNDCINLKALMRCTTTSNTPTPVLLADGYSFNAITRLTIPNGKILLASVLIVGAKSDGSSTATYMRKFAIKNLSNTVSMVGTVDTLGVDYEDNASTDVVITADNTNKALQINVTGVASETWRWLAVVEGLEIAFGT